jgi:hypothetical protein
VPLRVLVPMLKLPVVAPPPVALTTLAMVPSPVGRVSANVALVAVLGPALVITRLKVSVPPALGVAVLAVLLMPRSATSPTVMVAVPVLLPGVVSVVPGGVLTVATLAIVPLAVPATLTWKVTVMVPAGGSVTVPLRVLVPMLKLPVVAPPPVALTTLAMVPSPVGRVSANVALVAVLGPALVITRLKVSVPPALGVAVLAVLLMPRSATSPTVMVAVPVLLPGVVSVVPGGVLTVATLAIVPLAVPATLTWKVTVMVPAGGSVTVPLRVLVPMLKLPVVAPSARGADHVGDGAQPRGQGVRKCRAGGRARPRVGDHQAEGQCPARARRGCAGRLADAQVRHQPHGDGGRAGVVARRGVGRARRCAHRRHVGYRAAGRARPR